MTATPCSLGFEPVPRGTRKKLMKFQQYLRTRKTRKPRTSFESRPPSLTWLRYPDARSCGMVEKHHRFAEQLTSPGRPAPVAAHALFHTRTVGKRGLVLYNVHEQV